MDISCDQCGGPTRITTRRARVRRSGHVVSYEAQVLECDVCSSDDDRHVQSTPAIDAANAAAAAAAWRAKVGGEMPAKKPAGRKSINPHTEVVTVRMTPEDAAIMERVCEARGVTVAKLLRQLVREEAERVPVSLSAGRRIAARRPVSDEPPAATQAELKDAAG